jgi:hypothetical protein
MNIKTIISLIDYTFLLKRNPARYRTPKSKIDMVVAGCRCHMGFPPCNFCTDLTEEEAEIYANRGYVALLDFVLAQDR